MKSKWLVGGLIASLVLNIGLVGFLVGAASRPALLSRGGLDATVALTQLLRFLPAERREAVLREAVVDARKFRRGARRSLRDMRRAQAAMHKALAAEPFDAEALAHVLAEFRDHFSASQRSSHLTLIAVAERLTAEERRRFVDDAQARRRGKGRAPKRRGGG